MRSCPAASVSPVIAASQSVLRASLVVAMTLGLSACGAPTTENSAVAVPQTLTEAIDQAAAGYHVPREVLLAVSYAESRWLVAPPEDEHEGHEESTAHSGVEIGPLHLRHGASLDSLGRALALLHVDEATLRGSMTLQVAGAAAVLAELGQQTHADPAVVDSWADAVARYSGIIGRGAQVSYAGEVWEALRQGRRETAFTGEQILLPGRDGPSVEVLLDVQSIPQFSADYAPARWVPASSSNYTAGRSGAAITMVVIHTMQGSYGGSISWFQNSSAGASAQYMVRSSDGEVTQMVRHGDTAWHGGNWYYNQHSIGIEHEGYVADPARWYTEAMYVSSARLTRHLVDAYRIPIDRSHIIGHYQIPVSGSGAPCGTTSTSCGGAGRHSDPGTGGTQWNWNHYMDLVRGGAAMPMYAATLLTVNYPRDMMSGERAVAYVEYRNTGTADWDTTNTRLGTTQPRDHAGRFYDSVNWLNNHRPTTVDARTAPSATGRFSFMISAPTVAADTTVTESFGLVQEGTAWFGPADSAVTLTVRVHAPVAPPPPRDAGMPVEPDAGSNGTDAGSVSEDVSVVVDVTTTADVPVTRDTGTVVRDAGLTRDSGTTAATDAGTAPITGGCGCRTQDANRTSRSSTLGLVALSTVLALRGRRRSRRAFPASLTPRS